MPAPGQNISQPSGGLICSSQTYLSRLPFPVAFRRARRLPDDWPKDNRLPGSLRPPHPMRIKRRQRAAVAPDARRTVRVDHSVVAVPHPFLIEDVQLAERSAGRNRQVLAAPRAEARNIRKNKRVQRVVPHDARGADRMVARRVEPGINTLRKKRLQVGTDGASKPGESLLGITAAR